MGESIVIHLDILVNCTIISEMRKGKCNSLSNLFMTAYYVSIVMRENKK